MLLLVGTVWQLTSRGSYETVTAGQRQLNAEQLFELRKQNGGQNGRQNCACKNSYLTLIATKVCN